MWFFWALCSSSEPPWHPAVSQIAWLLREAMWTFSGTMIFICLLCDDEPRTWNIVKVFIQWYAFRATLNVGTLLLFLCSVQHLIRFEMCLFLFCWLLRLWKLRLILIGYENWQVWLKDRDFLLAICFTVTSLTSFSLHRLSGEHLAYWLFFIPLVKQLRASLKDVYVMFDVNFYKAYVYFTTKCFNVNKNSHPLGYLKKVPYWQQQLGTN